MEAGQRQRPDERHRRNGPDRGTLPPRSGQAASSPRPPPARQTKCRPGDGAIKHMGNNPPHEYSNPEVSKHAHHHNQNQLAGHDGRCRGNRRDLRRWSPTSPGGPGPSPNGTDTRRNGRQHRSSHLDRPSRRRQRLPPVMGPARRELQDLDRHGLERISHRQQLHHHRPGGRLNL